MKKNRKKGIIKCTLIFIGSTALTAAGLIVIPPLIDKYANKIYKASKSKDDIDIDEMGPEIVPYDKEDKND